MKRDLDFILAQIGVFVLIASYASFFFGLLFDIAYVFLSAVTCGVLTTWNLISCLRSKSSLTVTEKMSEHGTPIPGPAARKRIKNGFLILLGSYLLIFGILYFEDDVFALSSVSKVNFKKSHSVNNYGYDSNSKKFRPVYALDNSFYFESEAPGSSSCSGPAIISKKNRKCTDRVFEEVHEFPMLELHGIDFTHTQFDPLWYRSSVHGELEEISFALTKRHRVSWVEVREIRIVINNFQGSVERKQPCQEPAPKVVDLPAIYLARIGDPENLPMPIKANLVMDGLENPDANLYLADSIPTRFIVFILAETPGLYTYDLEVDLVSPFSTRTITIFKNRNVLFYKKISTTQKPDNSGPAPRLSAPAPPKRTKPVPAPPNKAPANGS
ncbi:hypothetical protein [Gimesia panareensis]|nr:hypothetical protein [Gimesia panareensis]